MVKANKVNKLNKIKQEIDKKITKFSENFVTMRYDKFGNAFKEVNPLAIKSYFFEVLENDYSTNPIYTIEQMNEFYSAFVYIVEQINLFICPFGADLKDFCKMTNLSNEELVNYKNNNTQEMKNIIEKLYDYCRDSNMVLAQNKIYNSNITTFKAKSELEVVEKKQPDVKVNIEAKVPLELINERLNAIRNFETKAIGDADGK